MQHPNQHMEYGHEYSGQYTEDYNTQGYWYPTSYDHQQPQQSYGNGNYDQGFYQPDRAVIKPAERYYDQSYYECRENVVGRSQKRKKKKKKKEKPQEDPASPITFAHCEILLAAGLVLLARETVLTPLGKKRKRKKKSTQQQPVVKLTEPSPCLKNNKELHSETPVKVVRVVPPEEDKSLTEGIKQTTPSTDSCLTAPGSSPVDQPADYKTEFPSPNDARDNIYATRNWAQQKLTYLEKMKNTMWGKVKPTEVQSTEPTMSDKEKDWETVDESESDNDGWPTLGRAKEKSKPSTTTVRMAHRVWRTASVMEKVCGVKQQQQMPDHTLKQPLQHSTTKSDDKQPDQDSPKKKKKKKKSKSDAPQLLIVGSQRDSQRAAKLMQKIKQMENIKFLENEIKAKLEGREKSKKPRAALDVSLFSFVEKKEKQAAGGKEGKPSQQPKKELTEAPWASKANSATHQRPAAVITTVVDVEVKKSKANSAGHSKPAGVQSTAGSLSVLPWGRGGGGRSSTSEELWPLLPTPVKKMTPPKKKESAVKSPKPSAKKTKEVAKTSKTVCGLKLVKPASAPIKTISDEDQPEPKKRQLRLLTRGKQLDLVLNPDKMFTDRVEVVQSRQKTLKDHKRLKKKQSRIKRVYLKEISHLQAAIKEANTVIKMDTVCGGITANGECINDGIMYFVETTPGIDELVKSSTRDYLSPIHPLASLVDSRTGKVAKKTDTIRSYVDQTLTNEVDDTAVELVHELKNMKKGAKKRYVVGLRECTKLTKSNSLKAALVVPDIAASKDVGGLDQTIARIIQNCRSHGTPVVFTHSIHTLGVKCFGPNLAKTSCIGLVNVDGAHGTFSKLTRFADAARQSFEQICRENPDVQLEPLTIIKTEKEIMMSRAAQEKKEREQAEGERKARLEIQFEQAMASLRDRTTKTERPKKKRDRERLEKVRQNILSK